MPMNIKKIKHSQLTTALSVQKKCLLCKKMALHAMEIEQPALLRRCAPSTFQTTDVLHRGSTGGRINWVVRRGIERWVSCEEE